MRVDPQWLRPVACALAAVAFAASAAEDARKTYRWVDPDGTVHYGDQFPPEHSSNTRQVLNEFGVPVRREDGAKSATELEAERELAKKNAAERARAIQAARRDQMLLDTYLSVEEIEQLRDRRLELIETQITVTENYLAGLRQILQKLQAEAASFKPYSPDPDAPPIDERLARELATTMDSIMLYEKNLADTRARRADVLGQFSADIDRFRLLKSGPPAN